VKPHLNHNAPCSLTSQSHIKVHKGIAFLAHPFSRIFQALNNLLFTSATARRVISRSHFKGHTIRAKMLKFLLPLTVNTSKAKEKKPMQLDQSFYNPSHIVKLQDTRSWAPVYGAPCWRCCAPDCASLQSPADLNCQCQCRSLQVGQVMPAIEYR
jgi:hypothetical protein